MRLNVGETSLTSLTGCHIIALHATVVAYPYITMGVCHQIIDSSHVGGMFHGHADRVDAVETIVGGSPNHSFAVHHHLSYVDARKCILALVGEMRIGDARSGGCDGRGTRVSNGSHEFLLVDDEDTAHIGSHPDTSLSVFQDVVSPGGGILATLVIDDEVHHLLGRAL